MTMPGATRSDVERGVRTPAFVVGILVPLAAAAALAGQPDAPRRSTGAVPALTPEVQTAEWAQSWWMRRHEQKLADLAARAEVELVMIGDSIVHGWEEAGQDVWEQYYGDRKAFNLGFAGDRTEQVLWRLANGAVGGIQPKLIVLMIGTNNTGHRQDPPAQTAAGIRSILDDLQRRLPSARILLLAIFPREANASQELRRLNDEVNREIARYEDGERIFFLDLNDAFLDADGTLSEEIMPDLLHPNERGYRLWAEAMEPTIQRLLGER
ncbi:MAG TPA: platelet-activating factor acetylhydrolase IB subunit [Thermoanaerobaculia bacterium]|nr:platelet-activating factor acetylhydrolase IB subunit [Thermoanaerobaculia bacterium]